MTHILPAALAACFALAPLGASAASLFSATYSGAEFAALATTAPNVTATVSGTSVTYDPTFNFTTLATLFVLSPGARGDLTFSITLDYTPLTTDNDLGFGFTDGTGTVAATNADNTGGTLFLFAGTPSALTSYATGIGFAQQITAALPI